VTRLRIQEIKLKVRKRRFAMTLECRAFVRRRRNRP